MLHSRNHSKCNLSVTEHGELIVLCGNEAKFCYVAVFFPSLSPILLLLFIGRERKLSRDLLAYFGQEAATGMLSVFDVKSLHRGKRALSCVACFAYLQTYDGV